MGSFRNVIIAAAFGIVGCLPHPHEAGHAEPRHNEHVPARRRAPDPQLDLAAARVDVRANTDLGCRTEVLGLVDVHEDVETTEEALLELKRRAAELGAEVVVGVDFGHGDGSEKTHLSGMAVRCRDLVRGRAYDVLGTIEVAGEMGREEDAFARLKERAREMKADLVIDVAFDHGEAGHGPTKLRGRAIRFRPAIHATEATTTSSGQRSQP